MSSMRLVMAGTAGLLLALGIAGCTTGTAPTAADYSETLSTARIYSNHMVLQREMPIRIAGFGTPGKMVKVEIDNHQSIVKVDPQGQWLAELPAMPAGGPHQVKITGKDKSIVLKDVLIGEVWVCSGQSNMEWPVARADNGKLEIMAAKHPAIRLFQVSKAKSPAGPAKDLKTGEWQLCSPATVGRFSAIGYFFGRKLNHDLKVPVGLINSSWGGTPIESWISLKAYQDGNQKQLVKTIRYAAANPADAQKKFLAEFRDWETRIEKCYAKEIAAAANWKNAKPAPGDNWKTLKVPGSWESQGIELDGVVWVRRTVNVPATWSGRDLTLSMDKIDDCDVTYFNGERVGSTGSDVPQYWSAPRVYTIPARLVKPGENLISVRIFDHAYDGGHTGKEQNIYLQPKGDKKARINLSGDWSYRIEFAMDKKKLPPRPTPVVAANSQNFPATLYNAMINPLLTYPLRGAIWYQGESNAGNAKLYRELFPLLITSWRKAWRNPDLVFLFVQLAAFERHTPTKPLPHGYFDSKKPGARNNWAELREAQVSVLTLPHTGMAVTIDIGNPIDIHPTNKQDVGHRLALLAETDIYGMKLVSSGPLYDHMKIEGDRIRLFFKHVGSGLKVKNGPLKCFAIAGKDGVYHWAEAKIDGETVVVQSPQVKAPTAVRYAWASYPVGCNLYNKEDLPASPFRTDGPNR